MAEDSSRGVGSAARRRRISRVLRLQAQPRRHGSARERRGRGPRGPLVLPSPLTPEPPRALPSRRDKFDALVLSFVERLTDRWADELGPVQFGTEDIPQLPDDWTETSVPFGSLVPASATSPARIVLFRRPIELRASAPLERAALVHEVLVEYVAELLGREASEIDP